MNLAQTQLYNQRHTGRVSSDNPFSLGIGGRRSGRGSSCGGRGGRVGDLWAFVAVRGVDDGKRRQKGGREECQKFVH